MQKHVIYFLKVLGWLSTSDMQILNIYSWDCLLTGEEEIFYGSGSHSGAWPPLGVAKPSQGVTRPFFFNFYFILMGVRKLFFLG